MSDQAHQTAVVQSCNWGCVTPVHLGLCNASAPSHSRRHHSLSPVPPPNPTGSTFAGTRLCLEPFPGATPGTYAAGSGEGEVLRGSLLRPDSAGDPEPVACGSAPHAGPIVSIVASPFMPGLLLSVGDWSFRLWGQTSGGGGGGCPDASSSSGSSSSDAALAVPLLASPFAEEAYTSGVCSVCRRCNKDTPGPFFRQ